MNKCFNEIKLKLNILVILKVLFIMNMKRLLLNFHLPVCLSVHLSVEYLTIDPFKKHYTIRHLSIK